MATKPESAADRTQTFIDWAQINARFLIGGAIVIVVAAGGYWFYTRSVEIKSARADQTLLTAKQSIAAGNAALATNDLQRLVTTYESTPAGAEGAMILAQLDYDQGKFQEGIDILQKAVDSHGSDVRTDLLSLIGDGYAQMKKLPEAAGYYEKAANATPMQDIKAYQLSKAARTYASAGKLDDAKRIWTVLAQNDSVASVSSEARVRLGELTAKPAS